MQDAPTFKYDGHGLEVEDSFLYLGTLFLSYGCFLKIVRDFLIRSARYVKPENSHFL